MTDAQIIELFENCGRKMSPDMCVYHDTSAFMNLDAGDVMIFNDEPFLISRNEKESGFGMDDDPKYWVTRTIDLKTGKTKIIKLIFFEEFDMIVLCKHNKKKSEEILFGDTAIQLLRRTTIPILVAKGAEEQLVHA